MTPLEIIALLNAAIQLVGPLQQAVAQLKGTLDRNSQMSDVEIAAYEALKASDHARDYWQAD